MSRGRARDVVRLRLRCVKDGGVFPRMSFQPAASNMPECQLTRDSFFLFKRRCRVGLRAQMCLAWLWDEMAVFLDHKHTRADA